MTALSTTTCRPDLDSAFLDFPSTPPNSTLLLILEHEAELGDAQLFNAFPWTRDDLKRMGEFRYQGAKTSWCISRILTRCALSRAAGIPRDAMIFAVGPFGKPRLLDSGIRFNVSHTSGCSILALSRDREIGCDIENASSRDRIDQDVARYCLRKSEMDYMEAATGDTEKKERFLAMFVEKEARLKADGTGLSMPLVDVRAAMKELPFREGPVASFLYRGESRFIVSVCIPGGIDVLEVRARRYS